MTEAPSGVRRPCLGVEQVTVLAPPLGCLERRGIFWRERLPVRELFGTLERRQRAESEDAGHIRLPIRCPHRHRAAARLGDR